MANSTASTTRRASEIDEIHRRVKSPSLHDPRLVLGHGQYGTPDSSENPSSSSSSGSPTEKTPSSSEASKRVLELPQKTPMVFILPPLVNKPKGRAKVGSKDKRAKDSKIKN